MNTLAALAHEIWTSWMKYMFSTSEIKHGKDFSQLQGESVGRWKRQMNTGYKDLSPKEQVSDKEIAAKWAKSVLEEYSKFDSCSGISSNDIDLFIKSEIMEK